MSDFAQWFQQKLTEAFEHLRQLLEYTALWLYEKVLESAAWLIEAIPVPSVFEDVTEQWNTVVTSDIGYFLYLFAIGEVIGVFAATLIIRFLIRRLPIVG